MKRLILMGGRPWEASDKGSSFTQVLFRYFPKEVKLAFCIFAQPESDWPETEKWNTEMFDRFKGSHQLIYKTMTIESFTDVSNWADIVYIPGGDPMVLMGKINSVEDISGLWENKVIAGSSAGADMFCAGFTYLREKTFGHGLGWIKATCIPHWRDNFNNYTEEDWDWAEKKCLEQYPDLPVLCIPEGKFVEFSVK